MTDSTKEVLHISKNVLKWLLKEGGKLVLAGIGEPDEEMGFTNGMLDEVPMDSPAFSYMAMLIQYIRTVISVLEEKEN